MAENNHICHRCGGELEQYGIGKLKCKYCDTIYEEEVINGEEGVLLVNAYKHLRGGETDDAYKAFIDIIDRSPKCYEAFLGVALANHGIVYVDDNRTGQHKRVPTCYNTTLTPFKEDSYFQTAVELAPEDIAAKYKTDADEIDKIRELWLAKAAKEKPYDVFISYKDTDDKTKERTQDSVLAQELYDWLTEQGYKVFFSRISLKDKLSENYEPYIYNALCTAKVMIVYAQSAENFNARWVRNEWGRWWKMIDSGKKHPQSLIVAYENMNVYDIPRQLLRDGMQALDVARKDAFPLIAKHIEKIQESLLAESGIVRVEVVGYNGKKATRIEGEKIAKKQLGTGVKKLKSNAVAGAVAIRDISARTQQAEVSLDVTHWLKLANEALNNGRYRKALEYFDNALANGANAQAYLGRALSSLNVKTDADFVKNSARYTRFADFDGIVSSCTEEELQRAADLYKNSESECLKNNYFDQGIEFFKKLTAYNIPQRQEALDIFRAKINEEMKKKLSASLLRLCESYCEAISGEDAEFYVGQVTSLIDEAMANSHYDDVAKALNNKIGDLEGTQDVFLYNNIRIELKSDLQGESVLQLYDLEDFSVLDKLLSNVTQNTAEIYNRMLVHAVFAGLDSVFEKKNKELQSRVVTLFKTIISYTYENYYIDGLTATEAEFKFAVFERLAQSNVKHRLYSDEEIIELKEYILKTLDEDAVDEYAAYEILMAVYYMHLGNTVQAKSSLTKILGLIPNDSNARILQMCCDYGVTEKDINAVRTENATNQKVKLSVSNAVIYALLKKIGEDVSTEIFTSRILEILKYCKREEDWQKDAQSGFYVANAHNDIFYKYLADFRITEKTAVVFATIARENLDYKYDPKTQYDYIITIFTDEILNLMNDTSDKKKLSCLADGYYAILQYIDASNKTFMCERLKFMGDYMLSSRNFELAARFYNDAIKENQLDSELYWKRLHANFGAVNTIELILSSKKVEDDPDFDNVLKLVDENQAGTYLKVPNKQEYLLESKAYRALLNKKKDLIPESDVDMLFTCSDDEFVKYLKDLNEKEQKEQAQKKESRNKAFGKVMAKAGDYAKASLILLVSVALAIVSLTAALKIDIIYDLFKVSDVQTFCLADKVALIATSAMILALQIFNLIKLQKRKMGLTIVPQILSMGLIAVSEFVLRAQLSFFTETLAWGIAIGIMCFVLAYCIWQIFAKTYYATRNALGKSFSTLFMAALYLVLPYIFRNELVQQDATNAFLNTQVLLIAVMVLCMAWGVFSDLKHPNQTRAWKAVRTFIAVHVVLGIVMALVNAIFHSINFYAVLISTLVLFGVIFVIKKS